MKTLLKDLATWSYIGRFGWHGTVFKLPALRSREAGGQEESNVLADGVKQCGERYGRTGCWG